MAVLFLIAYASSGMSGLIYQVSLTRLLALHLGHTTAAAATVVAAFMGGLALGSLVGGRYAPSLTRRKALLAYAALEGLVAVSALLFPYELTAISPILRWSYGEVPGPMFAAVRILVSFGLLLVPAVGLGATFPLAIAWFVTRDEEAGFKTGALYASNSAGAALGSLVAGFMLLPAVGIATTTLFGVAAGAIAVLAVWLIVRASDRVSVAPVRPAARQRGRSGQAVKQPPQGPAAPGLGVLAVGVSGFAALMLEIAWVRVLSAVVGPTTYAFAGTVTAVILGTAAGSAIGSWMAARTRFPAFWVASLLAGASIFALCACGLVGDWVPRLVARELARSALDFNKHLAWHTAAVALLLAPSATCLGTAFPLALRLVQSPGDDVVRRFSVVYAVSAISSVGGALAAGFLAIPLFGLQATLLAVGAILLVSSAIILAAARLPLSARLAGAVLVLASGAVLVSSPDWNHELLASGVYKYATFVSKDLNREASLTAGSLLYYREGAASTVSVKRLTGATSISVDGKVDASNQADMATQKLLAHLPLMMHRRPRQVGIVGLGSGVTLGAALVHPIDRVDVVEISPQVVEASEYFALENHHALRDGRVRLVVGDGRSHMLLTSLTYDVVISEPSNPWMTGVAALFTREFFAAIRDRLAPDGMVCQWAHTYDMSESDLRSIVATFASVFPDATLWLIGGDVLLVGSKNPSSLDLSAIGDGWRRPGVQADLRHASVLDLFSVLSLFVAGPEELKDYAAGATIQVDDRMALEFSGPEAIAANTGVENGIRLRLIGTVAHAPRPVMQARASAGPVEWRNRGAMMLAAADHQSAFDSYARAVALDPNDAAALDGLVVTAVATRRNEEALLLMGRSRVDGAWDVAPLLARSRLMAASGALQQALAAAREARALRPADSTPLVQLASILADTGDADGLESVLSDLRRLDAEGRRIHYYTAAAAFLRGELDDALRHAETATAADPTYAPAQNLLGAVNASLGRTSEARGAFEAALSLNPRDSSTYVNLGLLELSGGDSAAAAGYFEEALSLDPASQAAREGWSRASGGKLNSR